jgi:tetratricopeptide (TPR) repeat protein
MDGGVKQALVLGRERYRREDYAAAEFFLGQVARELMSERHAGYADVFDMLGVIAYRRGDFLEAEQHFRRAVDLNRDYTEAQLNLVITYNELGRYDEARDIYAALCAERAAAQRDSVVASAERDSRPPRGSDAAPDPEGLAGTLAGRALNGFERGRIANLHAETAQAYQDAGRLEDAIGELEKAVELGPGFADLRVRLAQLLRATGRPGDAEKQCQLALEDNPSYPEAYLQLCLAFLELGVPRRAQEVLERLKGVDPRNPHLRPYERAVRRRLSPGA